MEYLWYMLGYADNESMPVKSGDSAKIRAVKRHMKKPIIPAGDEDVDDYSRPHPEYQMTFEAPGQDLLLEVIKKLKKVEINAHKTKGGRRSRSPLYSAPQDSTQEESSSDTSEALTSFVPISEDLAEVIEQLKPASPTPRDPYVYAPGTVYHDICARRWEPEADLIEEVKESTTEEGESISSESASEEIEM